MYDGIGPRAKIAGICSCACSLQVGLALNLILRSLALDLMEVAGGGPWRRVAGARKLRLF